MRGVTRAYVGLGSNLGDRIASLAAAARALDALDGVTVAGVSGVYESEPWGGIEQPPYANAVAALDVGMSASSLLAASQRIERELGRLPGVRCGPRPIDIDLLLFGMERIATPDLVVPHPRLLEREFVVTPLLELAPGVALPGGEPITSERAVEGRIVGPLGPVPGFAGPGEARP